MEEKKRDINKNTGYSNTGYWNTGCGNTGSWNTGDQNTGNQNSGDWNVGDWNVGDRNVGNWNVGDRNIGDGNVGNWNVGDRNVGYFNIDTPKTVRVFGKECDLELWKSCKKPDFLYFDATEEITDYKAAFEFSYYKARKKEDWEHQYNLLINLPNFDYDIFKEISGIDLKADEKKE